MIDDRWAITWMPKTQKELKKWNYERKRLAREKRHWEKAHGINPHGSGISRNINTMPTWKGDPNDKVKIEAWKKSYEPGYETTIISPRDSSGKYTSNLENTVSFITMDKKTHAKEIAISLQKEPKVPMSIIDSLVKTLGKVQEKFESPAPTATTLTKTKGEEGTSRNLTSMTKGKYGALVIAILVIIFFLLKLGETK